MILNIHGLDGKARNTAYTILASVFGEERVVSPQVPYRDMTTEETLEMLKGLTDKPEFIVGNSFGGFYGTRLAEEFKVPCILINPCLRPDLYMDDLAKGYLEDNAEFIRGMITAIRSSSWLKDNAHMIFGNHDEVLNPEDAKACLPAKDTVVIEGGHRLSGEEFEKVFKRMTEDSYEKSGLSDIYVVRRT